jgi:hypothetical protein
MTIEYEYNICTQKFYESKVQDYYINSHTL